MKSKNILKLAVFSAAIMIAGMTQIKAVVVATTNTVQDISFTLTVYSQGATTHPSTNVTKIAVVKTAVDTKDIIHALSTNTFKNPKLVLVVKNNGTTNSVDAFEIRDGTNAPVVVTGLSISNSFSVKSSTVDSKTGIATGVKFGLLSVSVTNSTQALSLSGFATTTHASVKDGKTILGVDSLTADVSGTYVTNAITNVVNGSVNISGHSISKIP